jgi:bacterioferritin-associated ferredoxin
VNDRPVDRCVCHDITFADLVRRHKATGATFQQLVDATHATTGCGLCRWYVRAALATGQTRFPVLSDDDLKRIAGEPGH